MKVFSGAEAWANLLTRNPYPRWNTAPQNDDFSRTANARMRAGPFIADYSVAVKIKPGDRVFCIGSCFARNVEKALRHCDVDVASGNFDDVKTTSPDMFNIYNTYSMLNELCWALDPAVAFRPESFLKAPDGYIDPHTSLAGNAKPLDQCIKLRDSIIQLTRKVAEANFVIITLGLTEAWFDRENDAYLNVAPPRSLALAQPERFELRVLDHAENTRALEEIVALLRRHGRPDVELILTVSPVPFIATFSEQDVVTANTYSKSTLRCVAQDFSDRDARVHYIPIYDSVVNSHPEITWEADRIHVEEDIVRLNITNFLSKALADPKARATAATEAETLKTKLTEARRNALPAPVAPVVEATRLPPFETLDDSSVDAEAFPAGFPTIVASSQMTNEFGTAGLMKGAVVAWHSRRDSPPPHRLELTFREPLHCARFWMQSQNRSPERAPTCFALMAGRGPQDIVEATMLLTHKWTSGGEWASFEAGFSQAYPFYRLLIVANDYPALCTLQRLWLEPTTWERRRTERRVADRRGTAALPERRG
jgi:hypothetical protein